MPHRLAPYGHDADYAHTKLGDERKGQPESEAVAARHAAGREQVLLASSAPLSGSRSLTSRLAERERPYGRKQLAALSALKAAGKKLATLAEDAVPHNLAAREAVYPAEQTAALEADPEVGLPSEGSTLSYYLADQQAALPA